MNQPTIAIVHLPTQSEYSTLPWQLISAAKPFAQKISGEIVLLALGKTGSNLSVDAGKFGYKTLFTLDVSQDASAEQLATVLTQTYHALRPKIVILADSYLAREIIAQCAAQLKLPAYTNIQQIAIEKENIVLKKPVLAGKVLEIITLSQQPTFITLNTHAFPHPETSIGPSPIKSETLPVENHTVLTKIINRVKDTSVIPLEQARVIVTGGRGLVNNPAVTPPNLDVKAMETWRVQRGMDMLAELAGLMGGTVAATRSLVDSGFVPYELQVGQTGKIVTPELYIACGVSGAIQHTIGMSNSKLIIAINKDSDAPIFKHAHYGILGDVYEIVPEWIRQLKEQN
ncbi:MAG: hypothetical protein CVU39_17710 [Chloroflexi bacterium HGW-Chloroflexi-10]|nr:MAG: hypothetical protein CVU39_17710 [Chloroflexi bacterium HGW-Chloroflexi-10]